MISCLHSYIYIVGKLWLKIGCKKQYLFFLQNILSKFKCAELCRFINYVSKYGKCPVTVCQRVKGQYIYLNTRIEILVLFQLYVSMEIFIP